MINRRGIHIPKKHPMPADPNDPNRPKSFAAHLDEIRSRDSNACCTRASGTGNFICPCGKEIPNTSGLPTMMGKHFRCKACRENPPQNGPTTMADRPTDNKVVVESPSRRTTKERNKRAGNTRYLVSEKDAHMVSMDEGGKPDERIIDYNHRARRRYNNTSTSV